MKKNILKVVFVAAFALAAGYGVYTAKTQTNLSDIALDNVEALAGDESDKKCTDSCKEWSGSTGGGIACDCGRYTGKCKNRC